jgi:hypothetical protein
VTCASPLPLVLRPPQKWDLAGLSIPGMARVDKLSSSLDPSSLANPPELFPSPDIFIFQQLLAESPPLATLFTTAIIDPKALNFVPGAFWSSGMSSLQMLHDDYFGRKCSVNRRFEHKLWNALRITAAFPEMLKLVGVVWVTDDIIKVYKYTFATFLRIQFINGGLFHKQGNFTRHGFVMITDADARQRVSLEHLVDVDHEDVLLMTHPGGQFLMSSPEDSISTCRWKNLSVASRVAAFQIPLVN